MVLGSSLCFLSGRWLVWRRLPVAYCQLTEKGKKCFNLYLITRIRGNGRFLGEFEACFGCAPTR